MRHVELSNSIRSLTNKAVKFVQEEKFEQCFEIVSERQTLLERLSELLEKEQLLSNFAIKTEYIELLKYLQSEDKIALSALNHQRGELLSDFKHRSKVKKAINAYNNTLLSK